MPALFRTRAREQKVQYFQDAHPDCRSTRLGGSPESIALSARARARMCADIHNCQLFLNPNSQINFNYCTQLRRSPPVHVRICDHCVLYISSQKNCINFYVYNVRKVSDGDPKTHVQSDHEKLKPFSHHKSFDKLCS